MKNNSEQPYFGPPKDGLDSPTEKYVPPADGLDSPTEKYVPPADGLDSPTEQYMPLAEGSAFAAGEYGDHVSPDTNVQHSIPPQQSFAQAAYSAPSQPTEQYDPVFPVEQVSLAYPQMPAPAYAAPLGTNPNYAMVPPKKNTGNNVLIGMLIGVILAGLGVAAGFFVMEWGEHEDGSQRLTSETQSYDEKSDRDERDTSRERSDDSNSDEDGRESGAEGSSDDGDSDKESSSSSRTKEQTTRTAPSQSTPQPEPRPAPQWPPAGSTSTCSSTVAVNDVTSCDFASNVASSYFTDGDGVLYGVWSPVTGLYYDMTCSSANGVAICTGGNNARVFIKYY